MKLMFSKINRKLDQLKRQYVPLNTQYRPTRVVPVSAEYHQETNGKHFEHIPLAQKQAVVLPIPEDLKQELFLPTIIDVYDEKQHAFVAESNVFINVIPEGRLYSDNLFMVWVITGNNVLLADSSFQFHKGYPVDPKQKTLIRQTFFKKPARINGTVCNLLNGGGGAYNFYHWMVDVLPRLHMLKKAGWLHKVDYFVVPNYEAEFQKASLKAFGITEDQVITCHPTMHIQADRLISTSHPRSFRSLLTPKWVVDFHKDCFLRLIDKEKPSPSKVYISRQDTRFRPMYNEGELIEQLRAKGFAIVTLSKLSFLEKVKLFYQADVLVGATGAGFTPLMYCRPGTKFLEIFGRDMVHIHYYNLAYLSQLDYQFVVCKKGNDKLSKRKESTTAGFYIDLEQIAEKVDQMI
jgi:capsular polysaccharide biosynthesis protein